MKRQLFVSVLSAVCVIGWMPSSHAADTGEFVVNGVAKNVRSDGAPWQFDNGALFGGGTGNTLYANQPIISAELERSATVSVPLRPWRSTMRVIRFTALEPIRKLVVAGLQTEPPVRPKVSKRREHRRSAVPAGSGDPRRARFSDEFVGNLLEAPQPLPHEDLFVQGVGGYHTYRIPAIVVTTKGTLLAFCEGRKIGRGDAGNIDMLVTRSTDNGNTWSDPQVVWDDGNNTCGNPAPVVDQNTGIVWLPMTWNLGSDHEREILAGSSQDVRQVYVTHSEDDGVTWAKPEMISETTRQSHWRWYATGPGNAIQLTRGPHAGRLLIPANHSDHSDAEEHPYRSHVFWSDDHGKTWQLGGVHKARTNESAVVELADGSLLQAMRSYHGQNRRAMSSSRDGGKTWSEVYLDDALDTPVCQANILRYSWPDDESRGSRSRILFSSPRGSSRSHLTVWLSYDEGKTWPVSKEIHPGGSAYSNLVALPDGCIGVLYEKDGYRTISLATFDLAWLEEDSQRQIAP